MSDQIIVAKQGSFGRLQITLPMPVKDSIMKWIENSGMGRAEFLRVALMIGSRILAESIQAKQPNEGFFTEEESS